MITQSCALVIDNFWKLNRSSTRLAKPPAAIPPWMPWVKRSGTCSLWPDRGGLDILQEVIKGYPSVRVLIMSGRAEEHYARHVLRAGAYGYLQKGESPQEFLTAIRTVYEAVDM
jgi:hypothetical protein